MARKKEIRMFENVGDKVTAELCTVYYALGFNCIWNDGKDLLLIPKEKDLPAGEQK